jgi:two-component system sensor histidine kinase PilS (NtrC family)
MSLKTIPLRQEQPSWKGLRLFSLYRIVIAGLFLIAGISETEAQILNVLNPELYLFASSLFLFTGLFLSLMARFHRPSFGIQVWSQAAADLVFLILLLHASGGIYSGIGVLLIVSVATISLLRPGIMALFYAAIASLVLLADQIYGYWIQDYSQPAYMGTGIHGLTLFGIAFFASRLSRWARTSEVLAEQRRIELQNMAQLNELIIDHMQSGVIVIDETDRVQLVNQTAWRLLGEPGIGNPTILDENAPEIRSSYLKWKNGELPDSITIKLDHNNQELQLRFSRLAGAGHINTLVFLEDTAERKRAAQEMKLASLGRLTASIAHEIRNPLGAISHAAQLLDENPQLEQSDTRLVNIINDQSKRMNSLIKNILGISRREISQPERIELKTWLEQFIAEFSQYHNFDQDLITLNIDPEDTEVFFDNTQLHQVLWNLCSNAKKHACSTKKKGCLMLQGGQDGDYAYLDVIDEGPGIKLELQDKLFEPFFTTNAQGVGLGLYIAKETCENNAANLEYIAMPMGGSCFRIQFPRVQSTQ